ncbi:hypothetical protein D7Y23_37245 [Corallococcus sp. AB050B]|nr:hypothetical protein D7Y23_37245 [Corallococcus sp. AB050B]
MATGAIISSNRSTLGEYLAQFSWLIAVLTAAVGYALQGTPIADGLWLFILMGGFTLGLACGITALVRERSRLIFRVVVPASFGIVLNTPPFLWGMLMGVLPFIIEHW